MFGNFGNKFTISSVSDAQTQELLTTAELEERIGLSQCILCRKPSIGYKVLTRVARHPLTKCVRKICVDLEDDTRWMMTETVRSKEDLFYEFGILSLFRHRNVILLRETFFFKGTYYVFTELGTGLQTLHTLTKKIREKKKAFQAKDASAEHSRLALQVTESEEGLQRASFLSKVTRRVKKETELTKRSVPGTPPSPFGKLRRFSRQRSVSGAKASFLTRRTRSMLSVSASPDSPDSPDSRLGSQLGTSVSDLVGSQLGSFSEEFSGFGWSERHIAYILKEVLTGLEFLHRNNVIHRDLTPKNITIDCDGNVKISDFLLSKVLTIEEPKAMTRKGTVTFMAPEVIRGWHYTQLVDVWSFGILTLSLAEHRVPWQRLKDETEIMRKIVHERAPALRRKQFWSVDFQRLVKSCLQHNINARLSSRKVLSDKFFSIAATQNEVTMFISTNLND